jgi:hypothetical protein
MELSYPLNILAYTRKNHKRHSFFLLFLSFIALEEALKQYQIYLVLVTFSAEYLSKLQLYPVSWLDVEGTNLHKPSQTWKQITYFIVVDIKPHEGKRLQGSRKWERRGIVANVRYLVLDHGDRYLFIFWTCSFCLQIQFPFPFVTTTWIGDYFDNRLCTASFSASIYPHVINMIDMFCL